MAYAIVEEEDCAIISMIQIHSLAAYVTADRPPISSWRCLMIGLDHSDPRDWISMASSKGHVEPLPGTTGIQIRKIPSRRSPDDVIPSSLKLLWTIHIRVDD